MMKMLATIGLAAPFLVAVLIVSSLPARAIDFTEILIDDDGCPFKNNFTTARTTATIGGPDCPKSDLLDLTLGDLVHFALNAPIGTEQPQPTGDVKYKRFELSIRIRRAKDDHPNSEEITMMKLVVGLIFPPSWVGIVYPKIDPDRYLDKSKK
jgi:hypothetical protein